ncbi:uncharacterized protein LOC126188587 [Schistocerca cancellata]|uniref:uncharacterized protein LOC126188587 n=1 Tax=Schistocerca cancellata TaxID=274614 RepID=UPI0021178AA0|nr:uncharacterized protein LOC126188587 [Schistocerca cancellata]
MTLSHAQGDCMRIGNRWRRRRQRSERRWRARPVVASAVVAAGLTTTGEGRRPSSDPRLIAEMQLSQDLDAAIAAAEGGDERRADDLLESAVQRAQRAGAHAGVLAALDVRATLAQRRGDAAEAESLAKYALAFALCRLGLPRDHPEVLSWLLKLARLYSEQRRHEEAESAFQRCEALCRPHALPSLLPAAHRALAVLWVSVLFWHGYFLVGRQRFSEAAAKLEESYRAALCAPAASTVPEQRLVILFHLADALHRLGRYTDAIRSADCCGPYHVLP